VLDGLTHHETALRIETHYTKTGGASDHVHSLRHVGLPVLPAAARPGRPQARHHRAGHGLYEPGPLIGRRIKADVIPEHWGEILRLVASVQAGTLPPSAMLKRVAAYQRQNLFMLDWLDSPPIAPTLPGRPEQERAAARSGPGNLHVQTRPHRRSRPGSAAFPGVRAELGDRRNRVLENWNYYNCNILWRG
jgi:Tn3 transposase DDE domain